MGATKWGKGTKLMGMADLYGLPITVHAASASPHEIIYTGIYPARNGDVALFIARIKLFHVLVKLCVVAPGENTSFLLVSSCHLKK